MTVTMKNGSQYIYSQISPSTMNDFTTAKNKSEFYSRVIKKTTKGATRIVNKTVGPQIRGASQKTRRANG